MGFEEFGTVAFTSQTKINAFVERLRRGKISGTQCRKCGVPYFPPRADCCGCLSSDMEWFDVPLVGRLVSYSTLSYCPTGFENDLPYTLGLVRFENSIQIFGRISKTVKAEETRVGMALRVSPVDLPRGKIGYEFAQP